MQFIEIWWNNVEDVWRGALAPGAVVKLLPCDQWGQIQVLKTASCRNVGEGCVHKTQSGRTLPRTWRKRELHTPGCPFNAEYVCFHFCAIFSSLACSYLQYCHCQVFVLVVLPRLQGSEVMKANNILLIIIICQYVPRLLRIIPLYLQITRSAGIITETAWAGAAFNLLIYMLASHVSPLIINSFKWKFYSHFAHYQLLTFLNSS
jgi:hypothetical protein